MSTYFSLGNPELDFASNTISHMLNEGSKLLSSLSGCTLSKEAQWPVFPDGHRASSHSPYPPKPPSFPVQSGSWPTSAQLGLHRVVPSQVLSFAMPSGSHVPLRSGPDSQSISSRHWASLCIFITTLPHYWCFHFQKCQRVWKQYIQLQWKCIKLGKPSTDFNCSVSVWLNPCCIGLPITLSEFD